MRKIIFPLLGCLLLFASSAEGSKPNTVFLWQSDQHVIQSILDESWSPLPSEELDALTSVLPENIIEQSGKIVAGFQFVPAEKEDNSSQNPKIFIFAKTDVYVNQEMIQKTYAWLNKNNNLLSGLFSDKIGQVDIQNIEYIQRLPAILFQNNLPVNGHLFKGLSSIVFLKASILNVVCLADEKEFAQHEGVFRSFIESVVIPPALRHDTVLDRQSTTFLTEVFALLARKWQLFLGVFLIIGIYGWVFLTKKEKRV